MMKSLMTPQCATKLISFINEMAYFSWKVIPAMIIKLDMYHRHVTMNVDNNVNSFIDDIIMFRNKSKFWTAATA